MLKQCSMSARVGLRAPGVHDCGGVQSGADSATGYLRLTLQCHLLWSREREPGGEWQNYCQAEAADACTEARVRFENVQEAGQAQARCVREAGESTLRTAEVSKD